MRTGPLRDPSIWLPLSLLALLLAAERAALFSPHLLEWGDLALGALQIRDAAHGAAFTGPYSRFGFDHPGPAIFYWLAWTEPLLAGIPTPLGRHLAGQLVLNLVLLGLLIRVVRALASTRAALLAALLVVVNVGVLAGGSPVMLVSVWGPEQVILPVTLCVACAAAACSGRLDAVLPGTVAAVLAIHTHVGTVALVGPAVAAATAGLAWHARRGTLQERARGIRIELVLAAVFCVVTSLPVLVEQVRGKPGNLTLLVEFLRGTPRGGHGWVESLRVVLDAGTDWLLVFLPRWHPAPPGPMEKAIVLGILAVGSILHARAVPGPRRIWIATVWTALALSVVATCQIRGELEPYLVHFTYGLFGMVFAFAALEAWRRLPIRGAIRPRSGGLALALLAAALGVAIFLLPMPSATPDDRPARFLAGLDLDRGTPVLIEAAEGAAGSRLWIEAAGLALQLARAGYDVRVPLAWRHMYPPAYLERSGESVQRVLLTRVAPAADGIGVDLGSFSAWRTSDESRP